MDDSILVRPALRSSQLRPAASVRQSGVLVHDDGIDMVALERFPAGLRGFRAWSGALFGCASFTVLAARASARPPAGLAHLPTGCRNVWRDPARHVGELWSEVTGASIDGELRALLLKHIRELQNALENYSIQGALGISRAANNAIGAVIFAPHRTDEENSILKKFKTRVAGIALASQISANAVVLTDATVRVTHWLHEAPTVAVEGVVQPPIKSLNGEVMPDEPTSKNDVIAQDEV